MTLPLTKIPGVPDRDGVVKGMAHFAGTGPPETHCFQCSWWAFYDKERSTVGIAACEKYRKLMKYTGNKPAPPVPAGARSCKYFEARGTPR